MRLDASKYHIRLQSQQLRLPAARCFAKYMLMLQMGAQISMLVPQLACPTNAAEV